MCFQLNKSKVYLLLGIVAAVVAGSQAQAKLTLGKECGDIICAEHTFCSPSDHICRPCNSICNSELGNYDKNRCEEGCQDYLHDEIYAKKEFHEALDKIETELLILKIAVGVSLLLTIIVITLFIVMILRRTRRRSKKAAAELPAVIYNNKYEKTTNPVRRSASGNNNHQDFRREPSESTLPEYSYDNPSMVPSPSHHV